MLTPEEKKRIFFDALINFEGQFDADFLMKLLFGRANPDHTIDDDILRSTKLHVAVISKDCSPALVQSILAEDSSLLNQKNIFLVSPLHRAVYCAKSLNIVDELLKQGAYVNAVERSMMSSLHIAARNNNQYQHDLLKILIEYGGDVNCVDYINQTPLHMLVKNREVQEQSLCLLLENGANPNAHDQNNTSILKVAIQNPYVSLNTIKILLMFGANPEDDLQYCDKYLPIAKLFIQYIAVKKIKTVFNNIESSTELLPNDFVDLTFCSDVSSYLELSAFRDNCINELMAMRKISITQSYTLFKFVSEQCSAAKSRNVYKKMSLVEDALFSLKRNQFSYCSDLISASFEFQDILNLLSEQGVYAVSSENSPKVCLNYYAITSLASYITKYDLINLTVAYMSEHWHKNRNKRKVCISTYISKSTKRIHEGLSDSTVCMKRLKL